MMSVLVIAELDRQDGQMVLRPATRHAVTAGAALGPVDLVLVGQGLDQIAAAAAKIAGVAKVRVIQHDLLADLRPEVLAPVLADMAKAYRHVIVTATAFGKNLLPRIAALMDCQPVGDVIAIEAPDTFRRPIYAGNAIATVQSHDPIKLMSVRATAFAAAGDGAQNAEIEAVADISVPDGRVARFIGQEITVSTRPELTAARIVVSGGRGLGSKENFALLEPLADRLGAAIGASRAAVDAGFVPNDYQVGQTGKVVAPDLYIAVGISGAIQHLAGMKDSKVIVAINKDPDAPIFQIADYGLVGDLFEAIPALIKALET